MEHVGVMGELHASFVLIRDHLNVAQAKSAVVGFAGDISPVCLLDLAMKAIVHSDGQHVSGAKHMELDEPFVRLPTVRGIDGVL